ncbi:MAG: sensor domain-containing diguanylate cyclase [Candidatus Thiodiazotropha sp.]
MQKPDKPRNERSRLESLQSINVLDTPAEERFDRLARMAKRLFGVPIALVSLVDENRQWFKSCIGLNARETPRDISFCGHAILGDKVFVIPNAVEDERFADNPLVVDNPKIRFYAGCPLRSPDGHKLGTLCIIDREPRDFSSDDLEVLVDLAAMVEHELAAMQMATIDELTNISNRRGFMQLAQHSLNLYAREGIDASLVFIDLDNFKPVNDRYGHAEGDRVLAHVAQQLESTFRSSDIIARLGGDEFVVLLGNADKWRAEELIKHYQQLLTKTRSDLGFEYDISFSYGVVEFDPEKHPTVDALLKESDMLMYQTKQTKQKQTVVEKYVGG